MEVAEAGNYMNVYQDDSAGEARHGLWWGRVGRHGQGSVALGIRQFDPVQRGGENSCCKDWGSERPGKT